MRALTTSDFTPRLDSFYFVILNVVDPVSPHIIFHELNIRLRGNLNTVSVLPALERSLFAINVHRRAAMSMTTSMISAMQ